MSDRLIQDDELVAGYLELKLIRAFKDKTNTLNWVHKQIGIIQQLLQPKFQPLVGAKRLPLIMFYKSMKVICVSAPFFGSLDQPPCHGPLMCHAWSTRVPWEFVEGSWGVIPPSGS